LKETETERLFWDAGDPMNKLTNQLESLAQPSLSQSEADTLGLNSLPPHYSGRLNVRSSAALYGDVNRVQSLPDALHDPKQFRFAEKEYSVPVRTLNHSALISCRSESSLLSRPWRFRNMDEAASTFHLSTVDFQSYCAGDRTPLQTFSCSEQKVLDENGANSPMLLQTCNSSNQITSPNLFICIIDFPVVPFHLNKLYSSTEHTVATENHMREHISNLSPSPDQPFHMQQNKAFSSLSMAGPMATSTLVPSLLSDSSDRGTRSNLERRVVVPDGQYSVMASAVPVLTTRPPVARKRSESQCDSCIKPEKNDKTTEASRKLRNGKKKASGSSLFHVSKFIVQSFRCILTC
ncbi:uncharacterized protein DEA37_0006535, partial [Paragonimus westermani]